MLLPAHVSYVFSVTYDPRPHLLTLILSGWSQWSSVYVFLDVGAVGELCLSPKGSIVVFFVTLWMSITSPAVAGVEGRQRGQRIVGIIPRETDQSALQDHE